jgi:hypothetical protein
MFAIRLGTAVLAGSAMLAACGAGSALAPSNAGLDSRYIGRTLSMNGRLVTLVHINMSPPLAYTIIVPGRSAKPHPLYPTREYIINDYGSYADIFNYPKSDEQIGTINNVGGQGCTNVLYGYGKKIIWIVAAYNQITEYKLPMKPIKTLSDSVGTPTSCAMNTSGDLAVGIYGAPGGGDVVIYKNASGSGTVYTTPLDHEFFDGYDNQGNLFADGVNSRGYFALVELPKGSAEFKTITTSNAVGFPGSVQWDGKYLVVTDQTANAMYQYAVTGTKATLKSTITLMGSGDCAQTWIGKGDVFCADDGGEVFQYPAGGSPIAVLTGNYDLPLGTVAANK